MTSVSRWKVFAYAVALFLAGVVCGAAVISRMTASSPFRLNRSEEIAARIRQRLTDRLKLSPDQVGKIDPVIIKTSIELEASHRDVLNRITASLDGMHAQITPELTPDQKVMLGEIRAERARLFQKKYNYPLEGTPPARP
jgi:hypothetical protein